MKCKFYYVADNGCDMYSREYDFDTLKEAEEHARKQLAVDMQGLECIEISTDSTTRYTVNTISPRTWPLQKHKHSPGMKSLLERMNTAHEVADERACNTDCIRYRNGTCPFPHGEKLRCYIYRMHYDDAFGEIPFED